MILIGVPTYDGNVHHRTAVALEHVELAASQTQSQVLYASSSILTSCFNSIWAHALNLKSGLVEAPSPLTHFAMVHADIAPEHGWLEKMLGIMEEKKADVLSVVSPIKSAQGLTSTALEVRNEKGERLNYQFRRLTLSEIHEKEETFTDPDLLINTGLMLVDMRKPWVDQVWFHFTDQIALHDKKYRAFCVPEDWNFSRDAKAKGAVLYATRAIKLVHYGQAGFKNSVAGGAWKTDEAIASMIDSK